MYRVKSHLWPLCRAFIEMLCLGQQFLLHVWAKIVPRVRFLCFLHILHNSPLKNAACSCYICISGLFVGFCSPFACFACRKRRMLLLKSPFWPAWCLLPFWWCLLPESLRSGVQKARLLRDIRPSGCRSRCARILRGFWDSPWRV